MEIIGLAKKVTVYIGESDKWGRKSLHAAILEMLKQEDCAGATVTRALSGFGAASRIHTASIVDLSADLPLVIEWVDNPARIERVMPRLREMVTEGLITLHDVEVVAYSHRRLRELPAAAPVHDVMSREVHTVRSDTPLAEAVELLLDKVYRTLPVVDEVGRVVGILTDGDLLRRAKLLAPSAQQELTQTEVRQELAQIRQSGQTVGQVMTPTPITVTPETTITEAVKLMVERQIKRLPVVDAGGKLVGMVSRVNVLRALGEPPVAETPRQAPLPGHYVRVGEMMMTQVPTVQSEASLAEVVDLLVSHARRRVVVVDGDRRVVGIITDGDLIKRATATERTSLVQLLAHRLPLGQSDKFHLSRRTAAEVMTSPVITVTPDTSLSEALHLLLTHRIKRLPVVDADGRLVGLVGRGGVLQALNRELEA
jgi:CBS-domain-containing membrane protein